MTCSYIVENWQLWEDKVSACHDPPMNLQIYIWHMVTRNGWATAAEVEAAAILLNCSRHVILEGKNVHISQVYSSNVINTLSEIDIELLLARNHYRVLRKDLIELYWHYTTTMQNKHKSVRNQGLKILNPIQPH